MDSSLARSRVTPRPSHLPATMLSLLVLVASSSLLPHPARSSSALLRSRASDEWADAAVRWLMRQANSSGDGIVRRSLVGSRASAGCDYRRGSWVRTSAIPNYKPPYASGCAAGFSCDTVGRNPAGYVWVPAPPCSYDRWRFNPKTFLETMRNKIVAFVGDSLSDNLHASVHCILSAYTKIEFKKSWLGGARPVGSLHAAQYNFTLLSINSGYIVQSPRYYKDQTQPYVVNPKWAGILRYTHSIIFSAGHWFFHPPSSKLGSNPNWQPMGAYRKAMGVLYDYFDKTPYSGLPIFMTFSPIHAGNACATANAPFANETDGVAHLNGYTIPAMKKQVSIFKRSKKIRVAQITYMSAQRPDAHLRSKRKDCSHWCLPGVPDAWADVVYNMMMNYY